MPITRGQMERQLRMGGGIMQVAPRQGALLGGLKKAVKGVAKGIGSFLKSDLGKAALLTAGGFGLAGKGPLAFLGGGSFAMPELGLKELLTKKAADVTLGDTLKVGAMGTVLGGVLSSLDPQEEEEIVQKRNLGALESKLTKAYQDLNYDPAEIPGLVANDMSEYTKDMSRGVMAEGGRIGFFLGGNFNQTQEQRQRDINISRNESGGGGGGGPSGPPSVINPPPKQKTGIDILKNRSKFAFNNAQKFLNDLKNYGSIAGTYFGAMLPGRLGQYATGIMRTSAMDQNLKNILNKKMTTGPTFDDLSGNISYADFGLPQGYDVRPTYDTEGRIESWSKVPNTRFVAPSLKEMAEMDSAALANALTIGNVGYKKDLDTGKISFTGTEYDDIGSKIFDTKPTEIPINFKKGGRAGYAKGDTAEQNAIQASGIMDLPLNQNPAGITELDLRESGGFIPPVGVKEKADDIPAMLSNNEFVFTADAVRGMGDGNVNLGAQRMYDMMKKLENGGRV